MNLETRLIRETDEVAEYIVHVDDEYIETFVTNSPRKVEEWIKATEERNHLRLHRLIAVLDIKWNPESPVAILQLFVSTRCLIYRIDQNQNADNDVIIIPEVLKDFLKNQNYTFVGVGIESYKEKLNRDLTLEVNNTVDLRAMAAQELEDPDLGNCTLQELVNRFLRKYIDGQKLMSVRMSVWDGNNRLTDEQVQCASLDAYVSFNIARILQSWYD